MSRVRVKPSFFCFPAQKLTADSAYCVSTLYFHASRPGKKLKACTVVGRGEESPLCDLGLELRNKSVSWKSRAKVPPVDGMGCCLGSRQGFCSSVVAVGCSCFFIPSLYYCPCSIYFSCSLRFVYFSSSPPSFSYQKIRGRIGGTLPPSPLQNVPSSLPRDDCRIFSPRRIGRTHDNYIGALCKFSNRSDRRLSLCRTLSITKKKKTSNLNCGMAQEARRCRGDRWLGLLCCTLSNGKP